ncbi:hypothetical protein [Bartonella sp. AP258QHHD]
MEQCVIPIIKNNISLNAFESRKAELRGDGKLRIDFHLYGFTFSQMRLSSSFKGYVNRNTQSPRPHLTDKSWNSHKALFFSISDSKHVAALSLDVDLQATAKAHELLGKQRRKVTN